MGQRRYERREGRGGRKVSRSTAHGGSTFPSDYRRESSAALLRPRIGPMRHEGAATVSSFPVIAIADASQRPDLVLPLATRR